MRRLALSLLALLTLGAAKPAEIVVQGNGVFNGSLNGVPARLRIDPAAVSVPIVTAQLARRAGMKNGIFDFEYVIGPKRVSGETGVALIDFGRGRIKRRVGFTEPAYAAGLDGVVGPGLLPTQSVRFQLRPQRAGETVTSFPMVGQGGLEGRWGERFALVQIGGKPMRVQFDPHRSQTLATASAGARIASAHSGWLTGATQPVEVAFGVVRPARTLRLRAPLKLGTLALTELGVRTQDHGSVKGIAQEARPDADPDEIVVVGTRKPNPGRDQLKLGNDVLVRCSSITFDLARSKIRLSCL